MKSSEENPNPFGAWLKEKRTARKWSVRKLADAAGVCHFSLISQLENNTYAGKKGKPMQPDEVIVEGLAEALGAPIDEALNVAGYAGRGEKIANAAGSAKPRNFSEFAAALEELGVFDLQMFGGEEVFDTFTEFDYELFLEKMRNDVLIEVKRKGAK